MHSPCFEIGLALMAVLCGGIVGVERQRREKPAGMRTLILVALGSTSFTMASFIFNTVTGDSGRVVAQIVTGIGFLGAGVIMRGRGIISGATTAAMIWMTAAIGVVVGSGYAVAGLGLSVLVRLVMSGVWKLEQHSINKIPKLPLLIDFDPDFGKTRVRVDSILVNFQVRQAHVEWLPPEAPDGPHRLKLTLQMPRFHLVEMLSEIVADPSVKAIRGMPETIIQPPHAQQVF